MRTHRHCLFGIAAVVVAVPCAGQTLAPGMWTGNLKLDGGPTISVEFTLTSAGDALQATMNAVGGPVSPVTQLQTDGDALTFQWGSFACTMDRKNDSKYEGECRDGDGGESELTLALSAAPPRSDDDVLTREDLLETQETTVYDALARLRPRWLRARGPQRVGHTATVAVYLGSQRMGEVEFLRSLAPDAVDQVRYYDASDATTRFGINNEGGAIVITRRGGR